MKLAQYFVDEVSKVIIQHFAEIFNMDNKDKKPYGGMVYVLPDQDTLCIASSAKLLDTLEGLYPFPLQHQACICMSTHLNCHATKRITEIPGMS